MSCRTLLLVAVTLVGWGHAQPTSEAGETVTVRLEVEAEPGILVSRRNPPLIELSNPFGTGVLIATAGGEPYLDDPELYYARLDPVSWTVAVPRGVAPGSYPTEIRATFALCSKTRGVCFTDEQTASATVQVGGNETVVVQLRQPER